MYCFFLQVVWKGTLQPQQRPKQCNWIWKLSNTYREKPNDIYPKYYYSCFIFQRTIEIFEKGKNTNVTLRKAAMCLVSHLIIDFRTSHQIVFFFLNGKALFIEPEGRKKTNHRNKEKNCRRWVIARLLQ